MATAKWQSGVSAADWPPLELRAAFIVQLGPARSTCNHLHTGVSSSLDKGSDSSPVKHPHFDVGIVRCGALGAPAHDCLALLKTLEDLLRFTQLQKEAHTRKMEKKKKKTLFLRRTLHVS